MRGKILIKNRGGKRYKIKIRYLLVAVGLAFTLIGPRRVAQAERCPELRIVFARGSGGERWTSEDYLAFKMAIESKLVTTGLTYEFIDLDYPAVGVGVDHLETTLGAYFGAGEAYEFGESVKSGVKKLDKMVNSSSCPGTKYILGGYSQGAMVMSKSLGELNANRLIYVATFGDPKLYLPEGKGIIPAACRGENLSDYRMYVPDCQAYKGLLGAHIPYEPEILAGKVGTWCNKRDIFCSSHLNISDHLAYVSDNLYEDASRVIFDKITKTFGVENKISSPHDTAILIDSTGSMAYMIDKYKAEALRLARETLESGGRVALYDYRDLDDPYEPVEHCNFESCNLEVFQRELELIQVDGGGDAPESLLSASFHAMKALKWRRGSTKSLVVLTDADFLSPDRDGMSFDEVVALSKTIDPVNFYIITEPAYGDRYTELATATDGKVIVNFDELSLLTDYIMERYDSLPRVEEDSAPVDPPAIFNWEVEQNNVDNIRVNLKTTGEQVLVALNEHLLGATSETEIMISGLNNAVENTLILIPISGDVRGEAIEIPIILDGAGVGTSMNIPKAPNTGGIKWS